MLQQTTVERVLPKYEEFLARFPTWAILAAAPLQSVLLVWHGLGYNRRARFMRETARVVVSEYHGQLPQTLPELLTLPGIGRYTAAALLNFVFQTPTPLIETNVRAVYLDAFFPGAVGVSDTELLPYIERTLDRKNPRTWYFALMDYGSHLKRTTGNPNVRSRHHTRSAPFTGSNRQVRGALLRFITTSPRRTAACVAHCRGLTASDRTRAQLSALARDGLIRYEAGVWSVVN
jgi:A/G-specific adenine glycosylase